jgi:hypothetical protein
MSQIRNLSSDGRPGDDCTSGKAAPMGRWDWLRELVHALKRIGHRRWRRERERTQRRLSPLHSQMTPLPSEIPSSRGASQQPSNSSSGNTKDRSPNMPIPSHIPSPASVTGSHTTNTFSNIFEGLNQANIGDGTFNAAQTIINIHVGLPFDTAVLHGLHSRPPG